LAFSGRLSFSAEVSYVPAGWTTPVQGYFLEEAAGRDVLVALQSRRETSERWEAAYTDLSSEFKTTTDQLRVEVTELNEQFRRERNAWRAEVSRQKIWNIASPVIAVGVGIAIGRAGR